MTEKEETRQPTSEEIVEGIAKATLLFLKGYYKPDLPRMEEIIQRGVRDGVEQYLMKNKTSIENGIRDGFDSFITRKTDVLASTDAIVFSKVLEKSAREGFLDYLREHSPETPST